MSPLARRTTALAFAVLAVALAREASADPAVVSRTLVGRWRIEGTHVRQGFFAGFVDVQDTGAAGLRYERRVRFGFDRPWELERGKLTISGKQITLLSDPLAATTGLSTIAGGISGGPRFRRSTLAFTNGRFDGTFTVQGSQPDDRGDESLDRNLGLDSFELFVDGGEFFPRLREELRNARSSAWVETYSWSNDKIGNEFVDRLADLAKRGVDVRVIIDAQGSKKGVSIMERIKKAGGQVVVANPLGLRSAWDDLKAAGRSVLSLFGVSTGKPERQGLLNRDHRKLVLVDGLSGFTGGMGMGDHYATSWHDVMCRFRGPTVKKVQEAFLERWVAYGGKAPPSAQRFMVDHARLAPAGDLKLEVISSIPGVSKAGKESYLSEIRRARTRVLIENPYFLDDDIISALQQKAHQGVPCTVIVPNDHSQDEPIVQEALSVVQDEILAAGIDLRHFRDRMVHAKLAAIDHRFATIGSHNLDTLSLERLAELNIASHDPRMARVLEERIFAKDIPLSDTPRPVKRSVWKSVRAHFFHFIRAFV